MSASKKKKARQEIGAQGLTQKQIKEAKEAQAAKRKTIVYWIVGIVIVALVAALLIWRTGFFQRREASATVGEHTLTLADMQYYYGAARVTQINTESYYQQLYAQFGQTYTPQYDAAKSDSEQVKDEESGQTWEEYFKEQALNTAKSTLALVDAANAESFTLSADGKSKVDEDLKSLKESVSKGGFPSFESYLNAYYGMYLTESVFRAHMTENALANEFYNAKVESLTYTDEQLGAYQKENPANLNSYDFRYAYISGSPEAKTDEEGNTIAATDEEKTEAMKAAKAKADAVIKAVQSATGDKSDAFNAAIVDAVPEGSSYADPENNHQSGVLGDTLAQNGSPYFSWLSESGRKAGDITAIESGSGYYVVLFLKSELNNAATVDVRHILVKAELPVDDPETADVNEATGIPTEEALKAAKDKAQALLDQFNALPDAERTSDAFGKLANENSEDGGSNTNGGLYRYVEKDTMVPEFNDWIFDPARQSGDTGLVANVAEGSSYYGYHVMYFVRENGPKWHELAETALKNEDMETWVEGLEAPYTATWTKGGANVGK